MPTAQLNKNRASFPVDELSKYEGNWVAFDHDGTSIIAADADFAVLEDKVRNAGYNPADVGFESVPVEETAYW